MRRLCYGLLRTAAGKHRRLPTPCRTRRGERAIRDGVRAPCVPGSRDCITRLDAKCTDAVENRTAGCRDARHWRTRLGEQYQWHDGDRHHRLRIPSHIRPCSGRLNGSTGRDWNDRFVADQQQAAMGRWRQIECSDIELVVRARLAHDDRLHTAQAAGSRHDDPGHHVGDRLRRVRRDGAIAARRTLVAADIAGSGERKRQMYAQRAIVLGTARLVGLAPPDMAAPRAAASNAAAVVHAIRREQPDGAGPPRRTSAETVAPDRVALPGNGRSCTVSLETL